MLHAEVVARGLSPVKGTRHLALPRLELDAGGPVDDRRWCLVDLDRCTVLRTVQHPSLMAVAATSADGELMMVGPDGTGVSGRPELTGERIACDYWGRRVSLELTHGAHGDWLGAHLGRPVRLARAPRGGVVYDAPVTLVTTASLAALAARAGVSDLAWTRFRPTLVVATDVPGAEESWAGELLDVSGALLRVGAPVPRCAVIDHDPETGERDARLLRLLAATSGGGEPTFGVYATVERPGVV